jgi:hypothetical protein
MKEKIPWHGVLIAVQPRIRLIRSFGQRSHTYLGYTLTVRGNVGPEAREFHLGVGQGAHARHQFRAGDTVSSDALPVVDQRVETVEFYKIRNLKVRGPEAEEEPLAPLWFGVPPPRSGLPGTRSSATCSTNLPDKVRALHLGIPDAGRDDY